MGSRTVTLAGRHIYKTVELEGVNMIYTRIFSSSIIQFVFVLVLQFVCCAVLRADENRITNPVEQKKDSGRPSKLPSMLGTPTLVSERGYKWLEGARWDAGYDRLLFTDVYGDTLYELTQDGKVVTVLTPTRQANNIEFDPQGRLVMCEVTGRVSRLTLADGIVTDAVSDYAGQSVKFPNDLAILTDGTVFFSDSKVLRIYRISPDGRLQGAVPEGTGDAWANGLAISPDQKVLYATYSEEDILRAFDIVAPNHLIGPRIIAHTGRLPDGLCVDHKGNIYVGTAAGVEVYTPKGKPLGVLPLPGVSVKDRVTKCVFGGTDGRTLYVLFPNKLFRVPAKISGWRTTIASPHTLSSLPEQK